MSNSPGILLLVFLASLNATAPQSQFEVRYLPLGPSGSASVMAKDTSGNLFVVAMVEKTPGFEQIRAIRTDTQGNVTATFDFGGSILPDFGGTMSPDIVSGAAVDPQGNLVIVGSTPSQDIPLVSPLIARTNAQPGFIVKLDSQLTKIVFSTLLGTLDQTVLPLATFINAVAVDSAGNIYVTGSTAANDFPVTPGAFQTAPPASSEFHQPSYAFVTEIAADGASFVYSTYFGSSGTSCTGSPSECYPVTAFTGANAIALDSTGAVVIAGSTTACGLPTTVGTIAPQCSLYTPPNSVQPGFLAKFARGGKQLDWGTYIELANTTGDAQANISINAVAFDSNDNVIFGGASANGFPVTQGALQAAYPGGTSATSSAGFVAKVNPPATSFLFATYAGQVAYGTGNGVAGLVVDPADNIWLTGGAAPGTLPLPSSIASLGSAYLAELSPSGSSVLSGITAPTGAAGQGMVLTPDGPPAALGSTGSLLLELPNQPASLVGITNSAGVHVASSVAPYELVSLYGVGLGPAKPLGADVQQQTVSTSLGGVQVLFNNLPAPLLYVGPNQINAIVPGGVLLQETAEVQIVTPSGTFNGPTLSVVPSEPEVFQSAPLDAAGGAAIALNQDGSLNSAGNPAGNGSIVTVWATGGGLSSSPVGDGVIPMPAAPVALPVSVLNLSNPPAIDSLEVLYGGDAPGFVAGALQINFRLPSQNANGVNQLTCELQIGDAVSSPFSVYVQP